MINNIRFYISPYFLVRHYLKRDISYFAKKYNFEGTLLDFGCGEKPYRKIFKKAEYFGIDFPVFSMNKDFLGEKPDYFFDEKYKQDMILPFSEESFNNSVSFQVLEHHKYPNLMIREMVRVTKKGGLILLTCPFIGGLHEVPNDFQRLTEYKLTDLFQSNGCEIVATKKQGSIFSAISMLLNEQLNYFAAGNKVKYFIAVILYLPLLFFQYISLILDHFVKSDIIFINYIMLVTKK